MKRRRGIKPDEIRNELENAAFYMRKLMEYCGLDPDSNIQPHIWLCSVQHFIAKHENGNEVNHDI